MTKPLGYLDNIINAAERLSQPDEEPIQLPDTMRDVENELNLIREQALRSVAAAKEAEQRKNDLVVYLAHDLKTPLTSVIGYLTLLRDEPQISTELRSKYTGIALTKAERLEELINEFFDITRFNLTSLTLDERPLTSPGCWSRSPMSLTRFWRKKTQVEQQFHAGYTNCMRSGQAAAGVRQFAAQRRQLQLSRYRHCCDTCAAE